MDNNPRAVPGRKFSHHIFNPGPREAADFPKKWVRSAYWAFCSPQKRVSYDNNLSFLVYMKVVLTQGIGQLNLGDTSMLDEPLSLLLFGSTCRASYLLYKGTWEGGVVTEEMSLLLRAGTCRHCPLCLKSLRSAGWGEDRESSVSCVLSA